jgi:hypothetical protein
VSVESKQVSHPARHCPGELRETSFATPGLSFVALDKSSCGSIIGSLDVIREETSRKLLHPPVILDTFTADALPAAGFITAVAVFHVFLDTAISFRHGASSP